MLTAVGVFKTLVLTTATLLTLCRARSRHVTLRHCPLSEALLLMQTPEAQKGPAVGHDLAAGTGGT